MRVLALIPARGGSKRLPGKNIRPLGGKPLIVWSIEVTKGLADVCDTVVSTDDAEIANVARNAGALVPWMRPADLATDMASSVDVALHALDWYEIERGAVDGLLLLQPTSPLRGRETVERGIDVFRQGGDSVVGVSPARSHPMWCFRLEGERMQPFVDGAGLRVRSQDLPPAYEVNGALYLISPAELRRERSFVTERTRPLVMTDAGARVDIDTDHDWAEAEAAVRSHAAE